MASSEPTADEQTPELMDVEVAVAWPEQQVSVHVRLPQDATLTDAIDASGLAERFPQEVRREMARRKAEAQKT